MFRYLEHLFNHPEDLSVSNTLQTNYWEICA